MHTVQLKPTIKAQISGRMAYIGISDCDCFSILGENPSEEVDEVIIIIIMRINRKKRRLFMGARN